MRLLQFIHVPSTIGNILLVLCLLFLVMAWRTYANARALVANIRWIDRQRQLKHAPPKTHFTICIPAMNEQQTIDATVRYFAAIDYPKNLYRIVIATTGEDTSDGMSTYEAASASAYAINKIHSGLVTVCHHPSPKGSKPRQIAYAVRSLKRELASDNNYFAVFDADSRPAVDILLVANSYIHNQQEKQGKKPAILQQLSLYTVPSHKRGIQTSISEGAAMHQSLWTLAHEITRLRKQSSRSQRLQGSHFSWPTFWNARVANCVAHGLFIHGPHYLRYPLPEELLTEDWPYGLMQCTLRYPIHPLPSFDIAGSPARLRNIYRQKSTWFNPFFELLPFVKKLLKEGNYVNKPETYFLVLQAYASLFTFLLHSFIWLGSLSLALSFGLWAVSVWMGLFVLYWLAPACIYRQYVRRNNTPLPSSPAAIFLGSIYVLSHSVGPLLACARRLKALVRGIPLNRERTEYL